MSGDTNDFIYSYLGIDGATKVTTIKYGTMYGTHATGTIQGDNSLVLYLFYEPVERTLTFHPEPGGWAGGSDKFSTNTSTIHYVTGQKVDVPAAKDVDRKGYDLIGWTTVAGGTTPEYVAGTDTAKYTMTLDPDQHLYAVYAVRNDTKYTVEHYRVGVVLNANGTIKHVINVEDTPIYTTTQIGTTEATGTGSRLPAAPITPTSSATTTTWASTSTATWSMPTAARSIRPSSSF